MRWYKMHTDSILFYIYTEFKLSYKCVTDKKSELEKVDHVQYNNPKLQKTEKSNPGANYWEARFLLSDFCMNTPTNWVSSTMDE